MTDGRKTAIAIVSAIVAISIAGWIQWHYVGEAQVRYSKEAAAAIDSVNSMPFAAIGGMVPSTAPVPPILNLAGLPTRNAELTLVRNSTSLLLTIVILVGCFSVAYQSRSKLWSGLVGFYGWAVSGAVTGLMIGRSLPVSRTCFWKRTRSGWEESGSTGPPFIPA